MSEQDKYSDSAGVPWSGRSFQENSFSSDNGEADKDLIAALLAFKVNPVNQVEIADAFAKARVLIPLLATLGESGEGAHGHTVDKSAELSIVSVKTPDNQNALPVFTSVASMAKWNADARPVPNNGRTVALAAVAEGNTRVVLDPASETEYVLRRPALEAIAQGLAWQLTSENPEVISLVDEALGSISEVVTFTLVNGDPKADLSGQDLTIVIHLVPNLSKDRLRKIELTLLESISASRRFIEIVDSVAIRFLEAS
jgi:hypothetical protein